MGWQQIDGIFAEQLLDRCLAAHAAWLHVKSCDACGRLDGWGRPGRLLSSRLLIVVLPSCRAFQLLTAAGVRPNTDLAYCILRACFDNKRPDVAVGYARQAADVLHGLCRAVLPTAPQQRCASKPEYLPVLLREAQDKSCKLSLFMESQHVLLSCWLASRWRSVPWRRCITCWHPCLPVNCVRPHAGSSRPMECRSGPQ